MANRLVMTPHLGRLSSGRFLDYLRARVPGPALVITPAGSPVYAATGYPAGIGVLPDGFSGDQDAVVPRAPDPGARRGWTATAAFLAAQAEIVHASGGWLVGQIHHPGAERSWDSFQPSVAPSALDGEWPVQRPHELTDTEIDDLIAAYVANATWIVEAGLDGVEVHAAHGYLLNRFLSPAYNRRTGRFGGSVAGRWTLLRTLLERIRAAIGPTPILGVRLPAFEQVDGGLTVEDVAAGAASCAAYLSYVNLSLGNHDGLASGRPILAYTTPWLVERPSLLAAAGAVKAAAHRPVLVTGGVTSAAAVEELLAGGADLVGIARAAIADPGFARKVLAGAGDRIDQCIGCNECTLVPFSCPVNPAAGREAEFRVQPAATPATVAVVGGGPAGLSAGLAARARGHRVVVFERGDVLGGRLAQLVQDPARAAWSSWLERLCARATAELDVRLEQRPTVAELNELDPDVVVIAVGAEPAPTDFADDGSLPVVTSADVLAGYRPATDLEVLVVGGTEPHLDPLLTARLLAAVGHPVRLVSELVTVAPTVEQRTLNHVLARLATTGVTIETSTRLSAIADGAVTVQRLLSGAHTQLEVGAIVLAHSRRPAADAGLLIDGWRGPIHVIGDALAPRRLTHAVLEGTRFGSSL